jgi:tetratricopeptide (TPR) repeat protein
MEYKLLKEIRISLIDSEVSDVKEIKSAIKFLKWTNESDGYLIVYGIILQLENKFNEAIDVFKKVKYGDDRNFAFRLIADTYFQNKQYKNALSYYNKYQPILDSDRLRVESTISLCNTLIRVQKS